MIPCIKTVCERTAFFSDKAETNRRNLNVVSTISSITSGLFCFLGAVYQCNENLPQACALYSSAYLLIELSSITSNMCDDHIDQINLITQMSMVSCAQNTPLLRYVLEITSSETPG